MEKWDYTFCYGTIINDGLLNGVSSSRLWTKLKAESKTTMETVKELGAAGWELVAVTPIASWPGEARAGLTSEVLFTFKKPIQQKSN